MFSRIVAGLSLPRRTRAARRADLLDACLDLLDDVEMGTEPDLYPKLRGRFRGKYVEISLISDTLALKRLPQLWLSLVLRVPCAVAPLVVTVRPRENDYVSLAARVPGVVEAPSWLPQDVCVRGDPKAAAQMDGGCIALAAAFADPEVKEIAFVGRRIHLLYRLSEGRRDRHLIFREATFNDVLTAEQARRLLVMLDNLDPVSPARMGPSRP